MKKILFGMVVTFAISATAADALKNSLMPVAQKATPAINLDNLNVGAKPTKRASNAIIATVDGIAIKKETADKFLALASKGKMTDIDLLPKEQQSALIKGVAVSVLIESKAKKEVPQKVKDKLAASYWAKQEISKIKVSDDEAKALYKKNKNMFKSKDGKVLEYDKVSQYVKMQYKQQKFNENMMKKAKIIIK